MSHRRRRRAVGGRAGLTLLEVVVGSAILALLALVVMSATVPLSKVSSEAAIAHEMDRTASRVLADLRRELRQSGWQGGAAQFGQDAINGEAAVIAGTKKLTFRRRLGINTTDWSGDVVYERVAVGSYTGVPATLSPSVRYRLRRAQGGQVTVLAENVYDVNFSMTTGSRSILIELVLLRPNPDWRGGTTPPPPIVRRYRESVQLMNPKT
ncbi:MAG: hypothetical protein M9894_03215 [Planctomycetes bacterium]|nr:hypothetical protein [Planctomycetota bacterium]